MADLLERLKAALADRYRARKPDRSSTVRNAGSPSPAVATKANAERRRCDRDTPLSRSWSVLHEAGKLGLADTEEVLKWDS